MPAATFFSTTLHTKRTDLRCCLRLLLLLFITLRCSNNPTGTIGTAEVILIPENGAISPVGAITVPVDSVIAPTVTPYDGAPFAEWKISGNIETIGSTDNPASTFRINGNGTITATFRPANQFPIEITQPANATISKNPDKPLYRKGDVVTLTLNPAVGYRLGSWTGGASGNANPTTVTITGPTTVSVILDAIPGKPGVIYVWASVPAGGQKDGTGWVNAYNSLDAALTASPSGSEIWVAGGTYIPSSTTVSFQPKANMKILGGFNCFEENLSQRNFSANFSILSGPGDVLVTLSATSGVRISGFVFKDASYNGIIISSSNNDTIEDCIFRNIHYSAISLESSCLSNVVRRSVFHSNNDPAGNINFGKCINISSASRSTLIENSIFVNNDGPAVQDLTNSRANTDYSTITNCTIVYNKNKGASPGGLKSSGNTLLQGDIIHFNESTNTVGIQIDSTWYVEDCDIQDALTTTGIKKRSTSSSLWRPDGNYTVDPDFLPYSIGGALPNDQDWFSTRMDLPFMPRNPALSNKANFTSGKPRHDIRNNETLIGRDANFDLGAYETK